MKTGLVLEGGAMRGIYTAGVLDVFLESGISEFDGVIGVSAGALHGCSYVSKQKGRSIRYYKKYRNDRRFMSFWSLITSGDIVGKKFCYDDIPNRLDPYDYEEFNRSKTKFYVGCTNLETGNAEYIHVTDMKNQIEAMRASASMPYVSRIVHYDGMKLLDGGCTDSIPVKAFGKMGYKKAVVVLTRQEGYQKKPEKVKLAHLFYKKYPLFIHSLKRRHLVYNKSLEEIQKLEKAGDIFVIRPSEELQIGRTESDINEIQKVYELGRKDALNCISDLKEWLLKEVL